MYSNMQFLENVLGATCSPFPFFCSSDVVSPHYQSKVLLGVILQCDVNSRLRLCSPGDLCFAPCSIASQSSNSVEILKYHSDWWTPEPVWTWWRIQDPPSAGNKMPIASQVAGSVIAGHHGREASVTECEHR